MKDKVIVITGASSGIGAQVAREAAARGAQPVLVARRAQALAELAAELPPTALVCVCDVTRRAEVNDVVSKTLAARGRLDVWINNAGRGITRRVSELTDEDFDEMMAVNVKSALYGMQAALPHFRERGRGHIVNVSSMLGRIPFAGMRSAYSAAKHALNSLTANLRMELAGEYPNIYVTSVHPGVVATDFGNSALHGGLDSRQFPGAQSAAEVAQIIVDVIETPRADVYTRPGAQQLVVNYFAAQDMGQAERQPPFAGFPGGSSDRK